MYLLIWVILDLNILEQLINHLVMVTSQVLFHFCDRNIYKSFFHLLFVAETIKHPNSFQPNSAIWHVSPASFLSICFTLLIKTRVSAGRRSVDIRTASSIFQVHWSSLAFQAVCCITEISEQVFNNCLTACCKLCFVSFMSSRIDLVYNLE